MTNYDFHRGDICWYNDPLKPKGPTFITHGNRPVIVVSNNGNNYHSETLLVAPLTCNVKKEKYPGQIDMDNNGVPCRIRCDQIRVVDRKTLEPPMNKADKETMLKLNEALEIMFGLKEVDYYEETCEESSSL